MVTAMDSFSKRHGYRGPAPDITIREEAPGHMIETLFTWPRVRSKQLNAPLLNEREQYLRYMLNEG
jgi:hypothetical protein